MKYSLAVLVAEWKGAAWPKRYYLCTHVVANVLMIVASIASIVTGVLGSPASQMILLGVAALSGVQAALAWAVLQRKFSFPYSLW